MLAADALTLPMRLTWPIPGSWGARPGTPATTAHRRAQPTGAAPRPRAVRDATRAPRAGPTAAPMSIPPVPTPPDPDRTLGALHYRRNERLRLQSEVAPRSCVQETVHFLKTEVRGSIAQAPWTRRRSARARRETAARAEYGTPGSPRRLFSVGTDASRSVMSDVRSAEMLSFVHLDSGARFSVGACSATRATARSACWSTVGRKTQSAGALG